MRPIAIRLLLLSTLAAAACELPEPDDEVAAADRADPIAWLAEPAARADVTFYGEVTRVEYGRSTASLEGDVELPFTFVTYRIVRGIRGGRPGEEITLRFLGGPDERSGLIMVVPDFPLFDVGETDVVLVEGNGTLACPLVGCAAGRLRVVAGAVYTDEGEELRVDGSGLVSLGAAVDLPAAREHTIDGHVLRTVRSAPPDQAVARRAGTPLRIDALLSEFAAGDDAGISAARFSVDATLPFNVRL